MSNDLELLDRCHKAEARVELLESFIRDATAGVYRDGLDFIQAAYKVLDAEPTPSVSEDECDYCGLRHGAHHQDCTLRPSEAELDSPNFVPPELKELEERGYERINRWPRPNDAQTVCAYCGQPEGHSKRCSVTRFGIEEQRSDEATIYAQTFFGPYADEVRRSETAICPGLTPDGRQMCRKPDGHAGVCGNVRVRHVKSSAPRVCITCSAPAEVIRVPTAEERSERRWNGAAVALCIKCEATPTGSTDT